MQIPFTFWPEVVKATSYLKNRTIANTIELNTPFEILFGKKPNIKNLKLYGRKVFVRVPEVKIQSKWSRKADIGKLIGYDYVEYKVLINNKIITAHHADIIEDENQLIGFSDYDNNDGKSDVFLESDEFVKEDDYKIKSFNKSRNSSVINLISS